MLYKNFIYMNIRFLFLARKFSGKFSGTFMQIFRHKIVQIENYQAGGIYSAEASFLGGF